MGVVLGEATDILAHCVSPTDRVASNAILAVGYVQSGKTLSFTTVTSLARDNGYGIVVVLAGTTNNLKGQSEDRLAKDLGLEDLQRDWRHFENPDATGTYFKEIEQTLKSWDRHRNGKTQEEKPAVLVTVLKHATRIANAAQLLDSLSLEGIPVLVIDDESDQAGLNTKTRQNLLSGTYDESGTYESIIQLKRALPLHSFLQYTATPQANLLIAATDVLDPSFAKVITAGSGYTGGKVFFQERKDELIELVPAGEIFDPHNPFPEPPPLLQEALQLFLLGIAAGAGSDGTSNRSMMVQAHQQTTPHALYSKWVRGLLNAWSLGLSSDDPNAIDEIRAEFEVAHRKLLVTVPGLPSLDSLLEMIPDKIADIRVVIVNSTRDAEKHIKWKSWEYWILIGGQKLDRGFTVEGLTVTYMPRQVSDNADVLQQRARFFGYRNSYINYCRVYLTKNSIDAFTGYVDNEEYLRESLRAHEGQPLKAWKRDFILHRQLVRPTRSNVIGRKVKKLPLSKGWIWPKSMHLDSTAVAQNRHKFLELMDDARSRLEEASVLPGVVDKRAANRNLIWRGLPLKRIEDLLIALRFPSAEDSLMTGALEMALGRQLAVEPDAVADVVFMSGLKSSAGSGRDLAVLRTNIFVGMSPNGAIGDDVIYSGDRSVVDPERLTLQLRHVNLSTLSRIGDSHADVPWLAIYLPVNIENNAWLADD